MCPWSILSGEGVLLQDVRVDVSSAEGGGILLHDDPGGEVAGAVGRDDPEGILDHLGWGDSARQQGARPNHSGIPAEAYEEGTQRLSPLIAGGVSTCEEGII